MKRHAFHAGFHAHPLVDKVVLVSSAAAVVEGMTAASSGVVEKSPLYAVTFALVGKTQTVIRSNKY